MATKIKYKVGGLFISEDKKNILFAVGEEKTSEGKQVLLTPGGTVANDVEPNETQKLETLSKELEEELSLTPDMYEFSYAFNAKAKAATVDMLMVKLNLWII